MRNLFGGTHRGLVRKTNQDCYEIAKLSDHLGFAILCDGMGGENGGNIASKLATEYASQVLHRELTEGMSELSIKGVLQSAIAGANALVHDAAVKDETLSGMGTTMIIAVFAGDTLHITNVGDSRVYIISKESERRLSRDHTVVQMLVDIGEITEDDAKNHPKRHFITRAVGVAPAVESDYLCEELGSEEIVLLCSDGLYNYLSLGEFYPLVAECIDNKSVQLLIDRALSGGGSDNITAVVAN